jgi:hypothetical protein
VEALVGENEGLLAQLQRHEEEKEEQEERGGGGDGGSCAGGAVGASWREEAELLRAENGALRAEAEAVRVWGRTCWRYVWGWGWSGEVIESEGSDRPKDGGYARACPPRSDRTNA